MNSVSLPEQVVDYLEPNCLDGKPLGTLKKKRTIHIFLFALACQLISAPPVHAGWDFYFFGVNTKTFKEADWKMVALGAATSIAVHTAGHYAYAELNGMSIRQDGFCEKISFSNYSAKQNREIAQAGFVAQHL